MNEDSAAHNILNLDLSVNPSTRNNKYTKLQWNGMKKIVDEVHSHVQESEKELT